VAADAPVTGTAPATAPRFVWQNVSADPDKDTSGAQFGLTPLPGIGFAYHNAEGKLKLCSLGPAVDDGFLTAGHCTANLADTPAELSADRDAVMSRQVPMGTVTGAASDGAAVDSAVIRSGNPPFGATSIANTWPVGGVLTKDGVQQLVPVGSFVCIDGAVTGVRCGKRSADENGMIVYSIPTVHGDSGAPVFVVDRDTRAAVLIGIHRDGTGTRGGATYFDPALMRLDARAIVDKTASAKFAGPEFSALTVTR
jgi:V8-like Glu-specific endopeptidase